MLVVAQVLYLYAPLLVSVLFTGLTLRFELLPALRRPIDGGATFRGRRLFGDSKTWRVVAVTLAVSIAVVAVQRAWPVGSLALVDYATASPLALGAAIGGGALAGELPNSFVKRQLGIAPGGTTNGALAPLFYVWDQVDLLIGTWPLLLFWIRPSLRAVATSFALALVLHPLVALVGYATGARKSAR
jgi:CDP-2,3-bis-(O-geranylgeranyl)-sn-glycerol synthase